jgi:predicted nucleic acid-binding protein
VLNLDTHILVLIAATSVVHDVPLLTRDRRIRRSKVVPLA